MNLIIHTLINNNQYNEYNNNTARLTSKNKFAILVV